MIKKNEIKLKHTYIFFNEKTTKQRQRHRALYISDFRFRILDIRFQSSDCLFKAFGSEG